MSEPTFTSLFVIAKMLFEVANLSFDEYFKRRWSEKDHNSFLILPLGLAKYRYFACSDRMWQEAANNSCCCTNVRKLLSDLGPGYLVHTPQSEFWILKFCHTEERPCIFQNFLLKCSALLILVSWFWIWKCGFCIHFVSGMIEVLNEYTVLTLNNPKQSGHVYFKFFLPSVSHICELRR